MYCNKFFKTEDEAKAFQKSHGGVLYKNVKRSHTRESYRVEAAMAMQGGWMHGTDLDAHPYCVAWNGEPLNARKEN